jgi:hypothetical protein
MFSPIQEQEMVCRSAFEIAIHRRSELIDYLQLVDEARIVAKCQHTNKLEVPGFFGVHSDDGSPLTRKLCSVLPASLAEHVGNTDNRFMKVFGKYPM